MIQNIKNIINHHKLRICPLIRDDKIILDPSDFPFLNEDIYEYNIDVTFRIYGIRVIDNSVFLSKKLNILNVTNSNNKIDIGLCISVKNDVNYKYLNQYILSTF